MPESFKIAVFHNFLDNIGGAEMVSLTLGRELNADIYTTNVDKEKIIRMGFADVVPRIFSIGKVPVNAPWRQQLALWRFRRLNLNGQYDFFVIAGDWAMSAAVNHQPNIWYVHSPIREIWDLNQYVRTHIVSFHERPFFDAWVLLNRYLNKKYVKKVGQIVCNSRNTQKRVERYLNRPAAVIHPPTETSRFRYEDPQGYWLSVNRLIRHKRVDLQLKAFAQLPEEKLIVVGSYEQSRYFLEYAQYCQKIRPQNVVIKSWVTREELVELYANCKGFITTSHDEDFGLNVIEAMASGKPVIAPDEGGYKETVVDGKTGILIDCMDEEKLKKAVQKLGAQIDAEPQRFKSACQIQAGTFDVKVFIEKIREKMTLESIRPAEAGKKLLGNLSIAPSLSVSTAQNQKG